MKSLTKIYKQIKEQVTIPTSVELFLKKPYPKDVMLKWKTVTSGMSKNNFYGAKRYYKSQVVVYKANILEEHGKAYKLEIFYENGRKPVIVYVAISRSKFTSNHNGEVEMWIPFYIGDSVFLAIDKARRNKTIRENKQMNKLDFDKYKRNYAKIFVNAHGNELLDTIIKSPDSEKVEDNGKYKIYSVSDKEIYLIFAKYCNYKEVKNFCSLMDSKQLVEFWEKIVLPMIEEKYKYKIEW